MLYKFNNYTLDTYNNKLYLGREKETISSDPKLLGLLTLLLERYPVTVERSEIIEQLWEGRIVSEASLSKVISDLRHLLGDDGKSQQLIKTVHGKGFRFEVKPQLEVKTEVSGQSYKRIPLWCKIKSSRRLHYLAASASLLFLMAGAMFSLSSVNRIVDNAEVVTPVVAVLPMHIPPEDTLSQWNRYAIMAFVTDQLANFNGIDVIPVSKVITHLEALDLTEPRAQIEQSDFSKICGELNCTHLVNLNLSSEGAHAAIAYQLVDSDTVYFSNSYSAPEVMSSANRIYQAISDQLIVDKSFPDENAEYYSQNPNANRDYAIALTEMQMGSLVDAEKYFELALDKDETFFMARRRLYSIMQMLNKKEGALGLIRETLTMDLNSRQKAFVTTDLGGYWYFYGKFRKALDISKKNIRLIEKLGDQDMLDKEQFNSAAAMFKLGQIEQALIILEEMKERFYQQGDLEKEEYLLTFIATAYQSLGVYDKAMEAAVRAHELHKRNGGFAMARKMKEMIADINIDLGKLQDIDDILVALESDYAEQNNAFFLQGIKLTWIRYYQKMGNFDEALRQAKELMVKLERADPFGRKDAVAGLMARIYLNIGDVQQSEYWYTQLDESGKLQDLLLGADIAWAKGDYAAAFHEGLHIKEITGKYWQPTSEEKLLAYEKLATEVEVGTVNIQAHAK